MAALAPVRIASPPAAGRGGGRVPTACPLCPAGTPTVARHRKGDVWIARCARCGLVRQMARPAELAGIYGEEYYLGQDPGGGYVNYVLDAPVTRVTFAARLARIERRTRGRRLLDVGCGFGETIAIAEARGWRAVGTELSACAAAHAHAAGLDVLVGDLTELALPSRAFDAITLYDVIEHAPDPVRLLSEVERLVAPGGIVHIVTPDERSLSRRLLGTAWYHFKPDEHLFYFDRRTLRRAVRAAGLRWSGASSTRSYVTLPYLLARLGRYASRLACLEAMARRRGLGGAGTFIPLGELEAWAIAPRRW